MSFNTSVGAARLPGHSSTCAARPALDRAQNIARSIDRNLALSLAKARIVGIAQDISDDLDRAEEIARARDLALSLAGNLARDLARDLGLDRDLVLARAQEIGLALDLAVDLVRSLNKLLDREGIGAVLAQGALDDFTEADLSRVDLAEVDLVGVRWSDQGTRWPPGEEERMRHASRETEPGSGVWVVEPGAAAADMALA
jgi:hypothetical protein